MKNHRTLLGRHFSPKLGTVALTQRHRCSAPARDSTGEQWRLHRARWGGGVLTVGRRKRPDAAAFQGGGGAPVAEEGVDESCSCRRGRGR
jgi:hypothetical protein